MESPEPLSPHQLTGDSFLQILHGLVQNEEMLLQSSVVASGPQDVVNVQMEKLSLLSVMI